MIAANVPAMALAERMPKSMPLKQIRTGIALLFLAGALIVGVNALRLA